jgi:hypothetical protein
VAEEEKIRVAVKAVSSVGLTTPPTSTTDIRNVMKAKFEEVTKVITSANTRVVNTDAAKAEIAKPIIEKLDSCIAEAKAAEMDLAEMVKTMLAKKATISLTQPPSTAFLAEFGTLSTQLLAKKNIEAPKIIGCKTMVKTNFEASASTLDPIDQDKCRQKIAVLATIEQRILLIRPPTLTTSTQPPTGTPPNGGRILQGGANESSFVITTGSTGAV